MPLFQKVPIAKSSAKQKCPYCKMSPLQEGPQSINVPNAKCPYCKTVPFSFHVMRESKQRGEKWPQSSTVGANLPQGAESGGAENEPVGEQKKPLVNQKTG